MKLAVPIWNDRVSPVLDTTRHLLLIELKDGKEVSRSRLPLKETVLPKRADSLAKLDANVLICGAVSRPLAKLLGANSIKVIPWITGFVDDVVQAFLDGRLTEARFNMPGCRRNAFYYGKAGCGPKRGRCRPSRKPRKGGRR